MGHRTRCPFIHSNDRQELPQSGDANDEGLECSARSNLKRSHDRDHMAKDGLPSSYMRRALDPTTSFHSDHSPLYFSCGSDCFNLTHAAARNIPHMKVNCCTSIPRLAYPRPCSARCRLPVILQTFCMTVGSCITRDSTLKANLIDD